ncbi:hypothetical protein D5018_02100 [Parashewanella curva]|uniref:Uncharacterized protein n=1 Tax=Parashewanella curva TaxID=2338552 RepID=A0A3L8Q0X9_9GAMM|nr:hypothetical protein [Parashewanella curva]RLV61291.1 hypothetical protein D5018_02100 [Parashewanella curva]
MSIDSSLKVVSTEVASQGAHLAEQLKHLVISAVNDKNEFTFKLKEGQEYCVAARCTRCNDFFELDKHLSNHSCKTALEKWQARVVDYDKAVVVVANQISDIFKNEGLKIEELDSLEAVIDNNCKAFYQSSPETLEERVKILKDFLEQCSDEKILHQKWCRLNIALQILGSKLGAYEIVLPLYPTLSK